MHIHSPPLASARLGSSRRRCSAPRERAGASVRPSFHLDDVTAPRNLTPLQPTPAHSLTLLHITRTLTHGGDNSCVHRTAPHYLAAPIRPSYFHSFTVSSRDSRVIPPPPAPHPRSFTAAPRIASHSTTAALLLVKILPILCSHVACYFVSCRCEFGILPLEGNGKLAATDIGWTGKLKKMYREETFFLVRKLKKLKIWRKLKSVIYL